MERKSSLSPDEVGQVLTLADEARESDGAYPLAEQVVLRLRHGGDPPAVHLLAREGERLAGYAFVEVADPEGAAAELVVHPRSRGRGLGRALVTAAIEVADGADPRGRLRLWAHGDHPAATALARSLGFSRSRALWRMRRPLTDPIPDPALPEGVSLRAFRPGVDDDEWLAVNARAFADHPEQGRWTAKDLRARLAEPWFDPAGFLLAERGGRLLGFHWTKVHQRPAPIGEVYVLGVDPAAHGLGLGAALTLAGLRHLRDRGLDAAMLYVDEANSAATALYTRLGFTRWSVDVTFGREVYPAAS